MKENLHEEIVLGKGVTASQAGALITLKGPKGEVRRQFLHPGVHIQVGDGKIVLSAEQATKREKKIVGTFQAHLRNLVRGVEEPYEYTLKICSGHFPMNVAVAGQEFVIKNFLGEAVPRKVALLPYVEVKIQGTEIIVRSADREAAGQMAGRIEQLCRITNRDRRVFQDGCYITKKAVRAS